MDNSKAAGGRAAPQQTLSALAELLPRVGRTQIVRYLNGLPTPDVYRLAASSATVRRWRGDKCLVEYKDPKATRLPDPTAMYSTVCSTD